MMTTRATLAALAGLALAGCGPGLKDSGGQVRIALGKTRPVFDWDACTEFGVKRCGARLKVTSIVVTPVDCTIGGKSSGERPTMWQVQAAGTLGATLAPPVTYGVVPSGGTEAAPGYELQAGCRYHVQLGLLDGSAGGGYVYEEFSW